MADPLLMKLEQFAPMGPDERRQVAELAAMRHETYQPRRDILSEGEHVDTIHIVIEGLAARYRNLPDGTRQITAFLIPGDICDLEVFVLGSMDHAIQALPRTVCAVVPGAQIRELLTQLSPLTRALWWSTMTDSAVLRECIVDHGRRTARERLAHLFCELLVRYEVIGQAAGGSFPFPLTQDELADATGLTPVHVNRVLRTLREQGLIAVRSKLLHVLDRARLEQLAQFDPIYLHLRKPPAVRQHLPAFSAQA